MSFKNGQLHSALSALTSACFFRCRSSPDPSPLKGSLVAAWKAHPAFGVGAPEVDSVRLQTPSGHAPKTSTAVAAALIGDIQAPKTGDHSAWRDYLRQMQGRFMETGVYNGVALGVEGVPRQPLQGGVAPSPAPPVSSVVPVTPPPGKVAVTAELDEGYFAFEQSTSIDDAGRPHVSADLSLLSPFGWADRASLSVGIASADSALAGAKDAVLKSAGGILGAPSLASQGGSDSSSNNKDAQPTVAGGVHSILDAVWPTVRLSYGKPTLGGTRNRLAVSAGTFVRDASAASGVLARGYDSTVAVSTPDGQHSVAWQGGLRHCAVARPVSRPVYTELPPELVHSTGSSILSALAYRFQHSRMTADGVGQGVSGGAVKGAVEVAHPILGGEEAYLRLEADSTVARSLLRYMPDTGYAPPSLGRTPPKKGSPDPHAHLKAAPGCSAYPLLRNASEPKAGSWNTASVLAAWLAPGVTLKHSAAAGILVPLPPVQQHAISAPGSSAPDTAAMKAPWSHFLDRYTLGDRQMRGFAPGGIGPRALGRAVGGTLVASSTAQVLLPAPLPVPLLTHAGVRTHVWGSAGLCLREPRELGALLGAAVQAGSPAAAASAIGQVVGASCGVGVSIPLPIAPGAAFEVNWRMAAHVPGGAGYKGQLAHSALSTHLSI